MTITLHDIRLRAHHGCLPQERSIGATFRVSVSLEMPDAPAAIERDELSGTANYAEVYRIVREEMHTPSNLLEHVCGRICQQLLNYFQEATEADVTVTKCAPPIPGIACNGASVRLRMKRGK